MVQNWKLTTTESLENHKYMEIKQHGTEQLLGQRRNKRRDKNIHKDE